MRLSHKTTIQLNTDYSNIVGHMCYAAYKLWNVCNYERNNYKELDLPVEYPNWYYQKKAHKADLWYKQLPAQSAQEVCKLLDGAWKSFYSLLKSGEVENPRPPRYKHDLMPITYMQNGIIHKPCSSKIRLSLPKKLMEYMSVTYGIDEKFLFLENRIFESIDNIKQIKIYPPDSKGVCKLIVVYEVEDVELLLDNGKYLSIDLGLHNLMTCYDNTAHQSFIVGRKYLSICRKYDKQIARIQSQWGKCQSSKGIEYPKPSKHVLALYEKKRNSINDYLHKITHYIAMYCKENDIHTVVIGDITGIRKNNDNGRKTNQKLHGLPYTKLYTMLRYKLALLGIRFEMVNEAYSSQCAPSSKGVSKKYAQKNNRKERGCYHDNGIIYNADSVGAYNILRLYNKKATPKSPRGLSNPQIIKVAV